MAKIMVQDLLEAGVHFGHQTKRWNPKMKDYVYGVKNGIYIIDLAKTMHQLAGACNFLQHTVGKGGEILFVGTKRQAQEVVKDAAEKTDSYYITERWLGGTLTNNVTIRQSITKMAEIDKTLSSDKVNSMKKKEISSLTRNGNKLHRNLDGIKDMKKRPAALVVVDVCHEHIAVAEAVKLKIPVVAIVDTNANPDNIEHPIVANDDAVKSISVIVKVLTDAIKTASELYKVKAAEEKAAREAQKAAEKAEKDQARKDADKARQEAAKAKKAADAKATSAKKEAPAKKEAKTEKPAVAKKAVPEKKEEKKATPVAKKEEKVADKPVEKKATPEKKETKKATPEKADKKEEKENKK